MPPLTEYKLYISNFGNNNATQASTQTRDDDQSLETQTNDTESLDKAVQFPSDFGTSEHDKKEQQFDTKKLIQFLGHATQVCNFNLKKY